jgi:hypothetical protein
VDRDLFVKNRFWIGSVSILTILTNTIQDRSRIDTSGIIAEPVFNDLLHNLLNDLFNIFLNAFFDIFFNIFLDTFLNIFLPIDVFVAADFFIADLLNSFFIARIESIEISFIKRKRSRNLNLNFKFLNKDKSFIIAEITAYYKYYFSLFIYMIGR